MSSETDNSAVRLTDERGGTRYTFRPFEPTDVDGYLDLYEAVWDVRHTREWFRWRFEDNPYLDHVPVFVAATDGEIVAARPFFAFRMAVGDATPLALLTVDTMVHPDHRRRGLFTTLTERTMEFYTPREPAFIFSRFNSGTRDVFLDLGWRALGPSVKYYRLQGPMSLLGERMDGGVVRGLKPVIASLISAYLRTHDALRTSDDGYSVQTFEGVRPARLAELYSRRPPNAVHAVRDDAYYRWRFASPEWTRTTYLAESADEAVGAIARTRRTADGVTITQIADLVPMTGGTEWRGGVAAVLERILTDHRDSDVITVKSGVIPPAILIRFGFLPNDRLPLSRLTTNPLHLCVRPLPAEGAGQTVSADQLLDESRPWLFSYGELDTV